jgi:hypothetical protein
MVRVRIVGRVPNELQVRLQPGEGGYLQDITGLQHMLVLMRRGAGAPGGLAPDKADSRSVILPGGEQAGVGQGPPYAEPRSGLCGRAGGYLRTTKTKSPEPTEGPVRSELLLQIEAEAVLALETIRPML